METSTGTNPIMATRSFGAALMIFAAMLFLSMSGGLVLASEDVPSSKVSALIKQALSGNLQGRKVIVVSVDYPPRGASKPHRHPAEIFVYVEKGAVDVQIEDAEVVTYTAGQVFYEPPMVLHRVSRNASDSEPARVIAFVLIEDGKPVVIPEKQ